jgi:hypothetical protein
MPKNKGKVSRHPTFAARHTALNHTKYPTTNHNRPEWQDAATNLCHLGW